MFHFQFLLWNYATSSVHKGTFHVQAPNNTNDRQKMEGVLVAGKVPVNVQRAGRVPLGPAMSQRLIEW